MNGQSDQLNGNEGSGGASVNSVSPETSILDVNVVWSESLSDVDRSMDREGYSASSDEETDRRRESYRGRGRGRAWRRRMRRIRMRANRVRPAEPPRETPLPNPTPSSESPRETPLPNPTPSSESTTQEQRGSS